MVAPRRRSRRRLKISPNSVALSFPRRPYGFSIVDFLAKAWHYLNTAVFLHRCSVPDPGISSGAEKRETKTRRTLPREPSAFSLVDAYHCHCHGIWLRHVVVHHLPRVPECTPHPGQGGRVRWRRAVHPSRRGRGSVRVPQAWSHEQWLHLGTRCLPGAGLFGRGAAQDRRGQRRQALAGAIRRTLRQSGRGPAGGRHRTGGRHPEEESLRCPVRHTDAHGRGNAGLGEAAGILANVLQ